MERNNMRDVAIAGKIINEMLLATSDPRKMQGTRSINIPQFLTSTSPNTGMHAGLVT
jgi:hypothetical protein